MALREARVRFGSDLEGDWEVGVRLRSEKKVAHGALSPCIRGSQQQEPAGSEVDVIEWVLFLACVATIGWFVYFRFLDGEARSIHRHGFTIGDLVAFVAVLAAGAMASDILRHCRSMSRLFKEGVDKRSNGVLRYLLLGRFLLLAVPVRSREHLIGDLEEQLRIDIVPSRGRFHAWCWCWGQVLGIVVPYLVKRVTRVLGLEVVRGWRRR